MNDQERIELFKSLLGAVINVLDLPESEINELKTTPAELVRMVIAKKNDKIKAQTELLEEMLFELNISPEIIEKHHELEYQPAELVKMVIEEKEKIIKAQTEMLEDAISVLSLSPETIEKHRKLGTTPAGLIKIVIAKKNDKIKLLEETLAGINKLSSFKF